MADSNVAGVKRNQHQKLGSIIISVLMGLTIAEAASGIATVISRILVISTYEDMALLVLFTGFVFLGIDFLLYELSFNKKFSVCNVQLNFLSASLMLLLVSILKEPNLLVTNVVVASIGGILISIIYFFNWGFKMDFLTDGLKKIKKWTNGTVFVISLTLFIGWFILKSELFFLIVVGVWSSIVFIYLWRGWTILFKIK